MAIEIDTLRIMKGSLPPTKLRSVIEWAATRKDALRSTFERAAAGEPVGNVP